MLSLVCATQAISWFSNCTVLSRSALSWLIQFSASFSMLSSSSEWICSSRGAAAGFGSSASRLISLTTSVSFMGESPSWLLDIHGPQPVRAEQVLLVQLGLDQHVGARREPAGTAPVRHRARRGIEQLGHGEVAAEGVDDGIDGGEDLGFRWCVCCCHVRLPISINLTSQDIARIVTRSTRHPWRHHMLRKALLAIGLLSIAFTDPAAADVVIGNQLWTTGGATTLSLTPTVPGGNQPLNAPCIICGANQPQQPANFGYTDFKNNGGSSDIAYFSTAVVGGANPGFDTIGTGYDGSFLRAFLLANNDPALAFTVGFDVNDT